MSAPMQTAWPARVAVVVFGVDTNYISPVLVMDFTTLTYMKINSPKDLMMWADTHKAWIPTCCFLLPLNWK